MLQPYYTRPSLNSICHLTIIIHLFYTQDMTTLKDYLRDLMDEAVKLKGEYESTEMTPVEYEDSKDDLLDEYIDIIKKRIIGE